ncbi:hypothetical protein CJ030_MR8G019124 [Morella rubra]|uniref:Uncharacterized protein n=1 Tax=Morella rubra TaxID=262757 RepID=A0A6A1UPW4_9ROSI|nr:hypothetical protein CJ030_MR8G019124 [Morella rubra]
MVGVLLLYIMSEGPREPSMELTVRNVPIIFSPDELANFLGYERDLTAFPNLPMRRRAGLLRVRRQEQPEEAMEGEDPRQSSTTWGTAAELDGQYDDGAVSVDGIGLAAHPLDEALKTDATISLPHEILLTQFLHAMMVLESDTSAEASRVARVRRQEQPEEAMEGEDPGQSSTQGLGAQQPSWMDSMMTELSQRMESVLQPTHWMVSDISRRLTALEQKVTDMDVGWKKEVATLKEVLKGVATGAELFSLTERVVLIEEHLRHVRHVLKLTDDDDEQ